MKQIESFIYYYCSKFGKYSKYNMYVIKEADRFNASSANPVSTPSAFSFARFSAILEPFAAKLAVSSNILIVSSNNPAASSDNLA